jgi:hypothetical protein
MYMVWGGGEYNLDKDYTRFKKRSHTYEPWLAWDRYANSDVEASSSEAQKFLGPDWGDIVDSGIVRSKSTTKYHSSQGLRIWLQLSFLP